MIDGASHDDDLFLSSPEILRAMRRYLRDGDPGIDRVTLDPPDFQLP